MKKVPVYSLKPKEVCEIDGVKYTVTPTKTIKKLGNLKFQQIVLKPVVGNEVMHAPAGLMVSKVE